MPSILESGKLRLSPEEVASYRDAADHLHKSCQIVFDLDIPITTDEWLLLRLAEAALRGNLRDLDSAIARVQRELNDRKKHQ